MFLEFSKNFGIYFLKSMYGNMGIYTDFQKNFFWAICICAQISLLEFYVISGTDKSTFLGCHSILHIIIFQKIYILHVVQFFTEKSLPKELCCPWFLHVLQKVTEKVTDFRKISEGIFPHSEGRQTPCKFIINIYITLYICVNTREIWGELSHAQKTLCMPC